MKTLYFLGFIFPAAYMLLLILLEPTFLDHEKKAFYSEFGPVEIWQELTLLAALCVAIILAKRLKSSEDIALKAWIVLALVGAFYTLGEEISWGQTFFQWQTPEEWAAINGQEETNLHNTTQLLNQFPRAILEIGILLGGIVIPALQKWRPHKLPEKLKPFFATWEVVPTACFAVLLKIMGLSERIFGEQVFERKTEVIETMMYNFVLVYLLSLFFKWRSEGRLK